jgi:hypothetical protein
MRVCENRVLGETSGPGRDEMTGMWKQLRNEELHTVYSRMNIIRVIKSKDMWARHVERMRDEKCIQNFGRKPGKEVGEVYCLGTLTFQRCSSSNVTGADTSRATLELQVPTVDHCSTYLIRSLCWAQISSNSDPLLLQSAADMGGSIRRSSLAVKRKKYQKRILEKCCWKVYKMD